MREILIVVRIMQKKENIDGYTIIHVVPDATEEEKEDIKRDITEKIYKLFSNENKKGT
jgi:hypothetical protein